MAIIAGCHYLLGLQFAPTAMREGGIGIENRYAFIDYPDGPFLKVKLVLSTQAWTDTSVVHVAPIGNGPDPVGAKLSYELPSGLNETRNITSCFEIGAGGGYAG